MLRRAYGLRAAAAALTAAAYCTLAFIAWSLISLHRCGANEGCLGYVLYFWLGSAATLLILLLGLAIFILARRHGVRCLMLLTSISLLSGSFLVFLLVARVLR